MPLAIALTIIGTLLFIIFLISIPLVIVRKGMGVRTIYMYDDRGEDPQKVPPAVILKEGTPEDAFFDERDLAAREAHEERPEFVHTTIDVNGIRAGSDGVVPLEKEKGFWRR